MNVVVNAIDKHTSQSMSANLDVNSFEDFEKKLNDFEMEVPYSKFYYDITFDDLPESDSDVELQEKIMKYIY